MIAQNFDLQQGFTAIPNYFLDQVAPTLNAAELRVMLFIYRRTLGFQKLTDAISYSQFTDGITAQDGRRLDSGAGVSRRSLPAALAALERRNLIHRASAGAGVPVRYTVLLCKPPAPAAPAIAVDKSPGAPGQVGQNSPAAAPPPEPELVQKIPPTKEQSQNKVNKPPAAFNSGSGSGSGSKNQSQRRPFAVNTSKYKSPQPAEAGAAAYIRRHTAQDGQIVPPGAASSAGARIWSAATLMAAGIMAGPGC